MSDEKACHAVVHRSAMYFRSVHVEKLYRMMKIQVLYDGFDISISVVPTYVAPNALMRRRSKEV